MDGERDRPGGAERQRGGTWRAGRGVYASQRTRKHALARERVDQSRGAACPGQHEDEERDQRDDRCGARRRLAQREACQVGQRGVACRDHRPAQSADHRDSQQDEERADGGDGQPQRLDERAWVGELLAGEGGVLPADEGEEADQPRRRDAGEIVAAGVGEPGHGDVRERKGQRHGDGGKAAEEDPALQAHDLRHIEEIGDDEDGERDRRDQVSAPARAMRRACPHTRRRPCAVGGPPTTMAAR